MENLRKINSQSTQKGQGMIEFAIILLVLIGLFIGIFEIMTLFSKRTDLATVTRMAARQASESWVPTDADIEDEIEQYLRDEMVKMGYSTNVISSTVTAEVFSHTYNNSSSPATLDPGTDKVCTYGEYISVRANMDWSPAILPLDTFFTGGGVASGTLTEEFAYRCIRGQ